MWDTCYLFCQVAGCAGITGGADAATFQPMNVNFGLFPPIEGTYRGKERKQALATRALRDCDGWLGSDKL